jgi:integrase
MDSLSAAYLEWCTAESVPRNTVAARARVLRSIGNAGAAAREDVEAWWVTRRGLAPTTRANDLACLRTFYKWCERWEHRRPEDNPTLRLDAPKVVKGLPHPIGKKEMARLLSTLPEDLARAVALGGWAGLRVSEAAALSWADVDREHRRLRILGSKGSSRQVGLSPLLLDALLPDTGGNVITGNARQYRPNTLQRRVNRAMHDAGLDCTFHSLRHRFGDILAVGRAMGHKSPATTAIYAATSDEMLDRIAEAVSRL